MRIRNFWFASVISLLLISHAWFAHAQSAAVGVEPNGLSSMMGSSSRQVSQDRKLTRQTDQLVNQYRDTNDTSKRDEMRRELQKVVSAHFDHRQSERQKELVALEEEIKQLRIQHERRQNQKDRIVRDRIESLIREAEGLGWGSPLPKRSRRSEFGAGGSTGRIGSIR